MAPEDIGLSERSQSQRTHMVRCSFCEVWRALRASHARDKDRRDSPGRGEGKWGFLGFGAEFQTCVHMEVSSYKKTGMREWGWWWLERLEGEIREGKRRE